MRRVPVLPWGGASREEPLVSVGITDGDPEAQRAGDQPSFHGAGTSTRAWIPGHLCIASFPREPGRLWSGQDLKC